MRSRLLHLVPFARADGSAQSRTDVQQKDGPRDVDFPQPQIGVGSRGCLVLLGQARPADDLVEASVDDATEAAAPAEPPPLPFHTIEGVGGGAITPMAYLVNPGDECHVFGKPAVALTYVNLGRKNLTSFPLPKRFQCVEFGYAADRLGLGTLPSYIHTATGIEMNETDIWLHHFNVRALIVKENTSRRDPPARDHSGRAFQGERQYRGCQPGARGRHRVATIGYRDSNGIDYTLTATKTIPPDVLGRPLFSPAACG